MKRIVLLITGCLLFLALTACGAKSHTTETDEPQKSKGKVNEKEDIRILDETFAAWKSRTGAVWVNYSSVIKNSGNTPARIDDIAVDFLDSEEKIIKTVPMVSSIPDIILPNQTAYITESITLETVTDPTKLKATKINIESSGTEDELMMLKTDNVKLAKGHADINIPYFVTGTVTNPHSEKMDDIIISAALYNDKDKLLGVLKRSLDISLNPNGSEEFELNYPELPEEISGKVTKVKVKAYNSTY